MGTFISILQLFDVSFAQYLEFNESVVCGIFPAVNADLYQNAYDPQTYADSYSKYGTALVAKGDVLPFGEAPWRVLITDDYNVSSNTPILQEMLP